MEIPRSLQERMESALVSLIDYSKSRKPALVVSHYDADGLTAAAILMNILKQLGIPFHVKILTQLDENRASLILKNYHNYHFVVFLDMGSSELPVIRSYAKGKTVLIIDHHKPSKSKVTDEEIIEVNPRRFGIDGDREISSSGLTYLLARQLDSNNVRLAPLAIVGALGDLQDKGDKGRLLGLNLQIAREGIEHGFIREEISLRVFGLRSRPLVECLAKTFDPYIPGLSGNKMACYKFLKNIGIEPEDNGVLRMFSSLSRDEVRLLVTNLVKYMLEAGLSSREAEKIVGYVYLLLREDPQTSLYDAREYSALLNACGRMGKVSIGLALCLGDRNEALKEAIKIWEEYRAKLAHYLQLVARGDIVEEYKELYVIRGDIVGLEERISGAIASITTTILKGAKPILVFALSEKEGYVKVSMRIPKEVEKKIDVGHILSETSKIVGGSGGGHKVAGGANIPIEKLNEFVKMLRDRLSEEII